MTVGVNVQIATDPNSGTEQFNAAGQLIYRDVLTLEDIQLVLTEDTLGFNLLMAGNVFDKAVPLDFAGGLPGFRTAE